MARYLTSYSLIAFLTLCALLATSNPAQATIQSKGLVVLVHNDVNRSNPMAKLLENIAVNIVHNNLGRYYSKRYWLVGRDVTKRNFFDALRVATTNNNVVDVVILTHGIQNYIALHNNEFLSSYELHSFYLQNTARMPRLRFIYQGACWGYDLNSTWRFIGADVVTGAKKVVANIPLELPSITYELGVRSRSILTARNISWSVSSWIDRLVPTWQGYPVNSYKHITGNSYLTLR